MIRTSLIVTTALLLTACGSGFTVPTRDGGGSSGDGAVSSDGAVNSDGAVSSDGGQPIDGAVGGDDGAPTDGNNGRNDARPLDGSSAIDAGAPTPDAAVDAGPSCADLANLYAADIMDGKKCNPIILGQCMSVVHNNIAYCPCLTSVNPAAVNDLDKLHNQFVLMGCAQFCTAVACPGVSGGQCVAGPVGSQGMCQDVP